MDLRAQIREVEWNRKFALETIDLHVFNTSKPTRLITGFAVSSARVLNGIAFSASGAEYELPIPLLWEHDWSRPLGKITGVEVWGDALFIRAQIGNNLKSADEIWASIISK